MIKLYGIPNCDTVKKARRWLDDHNMAYEFHDFRKHGITSDKLEYWCSCVDDVPLLNRRGTTWRKLDEADKTGIDSDRDAVKLMAEHTSLIKRPVLEKDNTVLIGFNQNSYQSLL